MSAIPPPPPGSRYPYPGYAPPVKPKSRLTAMLLAIFLGWLGVHRFYLNTPVLGVIYLVFFWTGIPLVISLIEAVVWAFTSDQTFQANHH